MRRLAFRLGYLERPEEAPPLRPVGIKLELTGRCNLKCPFCYTDSPRQTRERVADLADDVWLRAVEEAIELGVLEAVVTGGEPFLRRDLSLEVIERFGAAGIAVNVNTNGWFVDEEIAARLGALRAIQVNVSIDGATPELHDGARGAHGSWKRALGAVDLLRRHGVSVRLNHVVTPANEPFVGDLLELAWTLGVTSVRLTEAIPLGAAARGGEWGIDRARLRRVADEFGARRGEDVSVRIVAGTLAGLATIESIAPAALLVRSDGAIWINSLEPFAFGRYPDSPLAETWRRIESGGWRDPRIATWAHTIRRAGDLPRTVNPYRDDAIDLTVAGAVPPSSQAEPEPAPAVPERMLALGAGDPAAALEHALALVRRRRYVVASYRGVDDGRGGRYVKLVSERRIARLNASAAIVLDALEAGPVADAERALRARFPTVEARRATDDVLACVRLLEGRGIVVPYESSTSPRSASAETNAAASADARPASIA